MWNQKDLEQVAVDYLSLKLKRAGDYRSHEQEGHEAGSGGLRPNMYLDRLLIPALIAILAP